MSEILGVLFKYLLALIAIVAVVAVLYEALGSSNTATAVADVSQIQANVYQLYSGTNASSPSALTTNAVGSGVFPASMVSSSGALISPFGSGSTISVSSTQATNSVLGLNFANLTPSSCSKLASSAVGAGASVSQGSSTATVIAAPADITSGAIGANVATACAPPSGSSVSSITINFYPNSTDSADATSSSSSPGGGK